MIDRTIKWDRTDNSMTWNQCRVTRKHFSYAPYVWNRESTLMSVKLEKILALQFLEFHNKNEVNMKLNRI